MLKLAVYLKDFKKQVVLGPVFKLIEAIFELIVPIVMARIIDIGIKNADVPYILKMGGVLVLLSVVGLASSITCQRFAAIASQGFGTVLRNKMFEKITAFSFAEADKFGASSLITRVTSDINQLQLAVAMLIRLVVRAPFLAIGSVAMAIWVNPQLSLVFLIITVMIAVALYLVMSKSVPLYRQIQKRLDKISSVTRENLEGIKVIRAFAMQDMEKRRFDFASDDFAIASINVGKLSALLNPLTYLIVNTGIIAILWFGGERVFSGALLQGELVALINYMTQILLALVVVANLVVLFTRAAASAARVQEVLDSQSQIKEGVLSISQSAKHKVSFKNVSFSYGGEKVLSNISFDVDPGETIGIIGTTGSGKTTLVNLIPRFYDVCEGEVLIDGVNVADYTFDCLNHKIGMVLQKAALFHGTVRENIKWGKEDATDEEIIRALKIAQAYEFVEKLPLKLDEVISQSGKNLSGGQKQRLTIARALVKNPEILILDDSSSALDYVTEAQLRGEIRENFENSIIFIISQRVVSVKDLDKIIVLDDGEIAGMGSHSHLFDACEEYRKICHSQEVDK
jgi:ATP-binding cassette subfamily B multidrug efflux pump